MLYLALLNQVFHRSGDVFDGHVRIDTVLIEQIDDIGLEALERSFGDFLDVFGTTVQAGLLAGFGSSSKPNLVAITTLSRKGAERFAHQFFVGERTVDFGGVEEGDAAFDGRPDGAIISCLSAAGPWPKLIPMQPKPEGRNFQIAFSKFAFLHFVAPSPRNYKVKHKRAQSGSPDPSD